MISMARSEIERTNRKAMSEALLAERLGLKDPWIDRWDENGTLREETCAPDELPSFITSRLGPQLVKKFEDGVDQLVKAGCQRSVVHFCLLQLSPLAEKQRLGQRRVGVQARPREELDAQAHRKQIATREDMASVASSARAARKQIQKQQHELLLLADISKSALPRGFFAIAEHSEDALLTLKAALTWVERLADSYTAPMETTLMKSKGLIYLTLYVTEHANERELRSSEISTLLKDGKRPTNGVRARRKFTPGNVLANLVSSVSEKPWSIGDLKTKLRSFGRQHPSLHELLSQRLNELHEFACRNLPPAR